MEFSKDQKSALRFAIVAAERENKDLKKLSVHTDKQKKQIKINELVVKNLSEILKM